jgi:hypothetical protein
LKQIDKTRDKSKKQKQTQKAKEEIKSQIEQKKKEFYDDMIFNHYSMFENRNCVHYHLFIIYFKGKRKINWHLRLKQKL